MKRSLITLALILVTALAIIAYRDSQIPRATATIQVHPSILPPMPPTPYASQLTQRYMESEFEAIISEPTMALAATLLGINKDHHAEAILLIKENVTIASVRGTDFITITAKDPNPQKAINTANAIAEAYTQRRVSSAEARAGKALTALDEELANQEKVVNDHRTDLTTFLTHYKIPFPPDEKSFLKPSELEFEVRIFDDDRSLRQHFYQEAVDHFTQSRNFLREMKIKQTEARILLKMPQHPITIHERATLTPSSPAPTGAN